MSLFWPLLGITLYFALIIHAILLRRKSGRMGEPPTLAVPLQFGAAIFVMVGTSVGGDTSIALYAAAAICGLAIIILFYVWAKGPR